MRAAAARRPAAPPPRRRPGRARAPAPTPPSPLEPQVQPAREAKASAEPAQRASVPLRSLSGSQTGPGGPKMRWSWGLRFLALRLLLLLAELPEPGDGNEGSRAGSCFCHKPFPPESPPPFKLMEKFRQQLESYVSCDGFIRFKVGFWNFCGGSGDPWVTALTSCFDRKECGHAYSGRVAQQKHSPPRSTQIPESTEGAPAVTDIPTQTYPPRTPQSTQQPTLPALSLSLDTELIHSHETTPPSVGLKLEAGPEAGENQKQLEGNAGPTAGIIMVLVLAPLAIFIGGLLYVLYNRRISESPQYSPGEVDPEALHGAPDPSSFQIAGNPPPADRHEGYLRDGPYVT